jgi:hypothetical protein
MSNGTVRVKDYFYDPGHPDIPRQILAYVVEIVSPVHRRGETFRLRLGPHESIYKPEWDIGEEFVSELP